MVVALAACRGGGGAGWMLGEAQARQQAMFPAPASSHRHMHKPNACLTVFPQQARVPAPHHRRLHCKVRVVPLELRQHALHKIPAGKEAGTTGGSPSLSVAASGGGGGRAANTACKL